MAKRTNSSGRVRSALLAATGGLVAATLIAAPVNGREQAPEPKPTPTPTTSKRPTLSYFLPRTDLQVTISQRLVACPKDGGDAEIETTITVTPERAADTNARVILDAGSGVFAKRTVKLELNPDQTLAAFNSTAEGQGGPVLKSIAKLAFKVAASAAGMPAVAGGPIFACTAKVIDAFASISKLSEGITKLEDLIVEGKGNPAATALLSDWRARRTQIRESLTLTTSQKVAVLTTAFELKAPAYSAWFETSPDKKWEQPKEAEARFPGAQGFQLTITPAAGGTLRAGADPIRSYGTLDKPQTHLVYRLPVGAEVEVVPCKTAWDKATGCKPFGDTSEGKAASLTGRVALMQLSADQFLKVGKGGLFGSRTAVAKFDAQGAPSALEYGTSPGTADAAEVLDTLRDAETEALKRAIAQEEARKKLAELRDAPANPQ
ncbi:MAG: hypothetical protein ACKO1N_06165 [Erythrobacter sp.]